MPQIPGLPGSASESTIVAARAVLLDQSASAAANPTTNATRTKIILAKSFNRTGPPTVDACTMHEFG
jgi:hypothetical protein